jgi:hypothetical protein
MGMGFHRAVARALLFPPNWRRELEPRQGQRLGMQDAKTTLRCVVVG